MSRYFDPMPVDSFDFKKRGANCAQLRENAATGGSSEAPWGPPVAVCDSCGVKNLPTGHSFCGSCGAQL